MPSIVKWIFYIPKPPNIQISKFENVELWTPHVPLLVHFSVYSRDSLSTN